MSSNKKPRTQNMELVVTQEIIDRAVKMNSTACVLADALKIATGGTRPTVDLQTIAISIPEKGLRYHWLTPRPAQRMLINFDQGAELSPTKVRLSRGWTTPIATQRDPGKTRSRNERRKELEAKEAAGTLTQHEAGRLAIHRETDRRRAIADAEKKNADATLRGAGGAPPVASLSNTNGRRYGLRLTKLTEHGQALVDLPK